jgi:hypothetical protein
MTGFLNPPLFENTIDPTITSPQIAPVVIMPAVVVPVF